MIIREEPAFKIKNANFNLFVLHVYTTDIVRLKTELEARFHLTPDFFTNAPMVLGLAAIAEAGDTPDFADLVSFTSKLGIRIAGVLGGSVAQRKAAVGVRLALFPDSPVRPAPEPAINQVIQAQPEIAKALEQEPAPILADHEHISRPTMIVDKPVRTGQRIYAKGADLVVLAIVNAGAELIADGDIHIYAPFRGRAIAGAHGNQAARIFVQRLEAELISIAGCFQVFENGVPENVLGKPAQVHLEGSRLVFQPLAC
jgi:septum site-determining protein MinC